MTKKTDLGIAQVKVEIFDTLPNINVNPVRSNFDITAQSWPLIKNSPLMAPLLVDAAMDELGTFGVMFPSKRKFFVDNFLADGDALANFTTTRPYIKWTPTSTIDADSVLNEFLKDFSKTPYDASKSMTDATYNGPRWLDIQQNFVPPTDDVSLINSFLQWVKGLTEDDTEEPEEEEEEEEETQKPLPSMNVICQTTTMDGLWWGIESSDFITEHMPFWVNIVKDGSPTTFDKETVIVISMGLTSTENKFDIVLSANNKPRIVDYSMGGVQKEWDADTARILSHEKNIEIGVMVAAGRLIIFVNKEVLVYTRVDKTPSSEDSGGRIFNTKIEAGKIRVYGTNVIATINACPMVFAPRAYFALNVPSTNQMSGTESALTWKGVNKDGDPEGSVAELPEIGDTKVYGVDCDLFRGDGGKCSPRGETYQEKGIISFRDAGDAGLNGLPNTNFYVVAMLPDDGKMNSGHGAAVILPYGGCPFFFRLKGLATMRTQDAGAGGTDVSQYVISVSESATAPDYFHVKRNATVTLYNGSGVLSTMTNGQKGIRIRWGWTTAGQKASFTGVVTSYNTSEKAGLETITLNCEDYMFVLKNSLIVNSPFYDGMLGKSAIFDLAKRGGCQDPKEKWDNVNEYFLPSGYAFTQPQVRFPPNNSIFDCINDVAKRFEAYFYFDGDGVFYVEKLPGGLFSTPTNIKANFVQDPSDSKVSNVILGEKNVTYDFNSTVNVISIITLDRDTRNYILHTETAPQNKILFRRVKLLDQPALGELEVARAYAKELGKRIYKAILKTSFKTVGATDDILPLDFVNVCGQPFRLMSIKRNFNADNNDFTNDYECEWLGG